MQEDTATTDPSGTTNERMPRELATLLPGLPCPVPLNLLHAREKRRGVPRTRIPSQAMRKRVVPHRKTRRNLQRRGTCLDLQKERPNRCERHTTRQPRLVLRLPISWCCQGRIAKLLQDAGVLDDRRIQSHSRQIQTLLSNVVKIRARMKLIRVTRTILQDWKALQVFGLILAKCESCASSGDPLFYPIRSEKLEATVPEPSSKPQDKTPEDVNQSSNATARGSELKNDQADQTAVRSTVA